MIELPSNTNGTMFTSIRLNNFKAYVDATIPLAPLTIIVGANNSGKSTILQSLLLLKQTVEDSSPNAALVTNGDYVDLGGFSDIVHRSVRSSDEPTFTISIGRTPGAVVSLPIGASAPNTPFSLKAIPSSAEIGITFGYNTIANDIRVNRVLLSDVSGKIISSVTADGKVESDTLGFPEEIRMSFNHFLPTPNIESMSSHFKTVDDVKAFVFQILMIASQHATEWKEEFKNMYYLGPLRTPIPRLSQFGQRSSSGLGPGGENLLRFLSSKEKIRDKQTLITLVNSWLEKRWPFLKNLCIQQVAEGADFYSLLADEEGGYSGINVAAMGQGIAQVLPIIARSLAQNDGSCLVVEQPELHLHPAAQVRLADLFIDVMDHGKRQVIVETHSEHLLLRLRRRIAEGSVKQDHVAILYVEKDGRQSIVRRLQLNDKGHFDDWPDGFFDEGYKEAMALAMAQPPE